MNETRLLMGMPITINIVDASATTEAFDKAYGYFEYVDLKFSPFKANSELSRINRGEIALEQASDDMKLIFALAEQTRQETDGYFDIVRADGTFDPSGIVKGWAIYEVAELLRAEGFKNFFVDAGGDFQVVGKNSEHENWRIGIRSPFNMREMVKALSLTNCGIATSGPYLRGQHIYNPKNRAESLDQIVSMTVIGPNIYHADRFATAAFAIGDQGILFIEAIPNFEGYMIDKYGMATYTSGFADYVLQQTA